MKYKSDLCHVQDCLAGSSQVFSVAGDMRYLPVVLSCVARKFRNRKTNYICKAHFLPEDMPLTRTGIVLSKRAVPCLQVPRKTLRMVIRSGISPKHSEVAGALLERARVEQAERDSSSDSDSPSEPINATGASQSPNANPVFSYSYVDSSLGGLQASEIGATQTYIPDTTALTLQQRLQLAGKPSIRRFDKYISRHDSGFMDYKRLKISDSESPQSQVEGDAASETSNGNSRRVEDVDEEDEIADVTDVGIATMRDEGDEAMDEDAEEAGEHHPNSHGRVRSHVKVITPRIRCVGTANKPRHPNHTVQHNHYPHHFHNRGTRHREQNEEVDDDDEDDDDGVHHRSGDTIEEEDEDEDDDDEDDDEDESLDERNERRGKRARDHDNEDDGDDDDEAADCGKVKKFRRNDNLIAHNADEEYEDFEEDPAQLQNRRRKRSRQRTAKSSKDRLEKADDGDDEEDQDYDEEDDDDEVEDEEEEDDEDVDDEDDDEEEEECVDGGDEDEPEEDVIPSPRKVQSSSRAAPQDAT